MSQAVLLLLILLIPSWIGPEPVVPHVQKKEILAAPISRIASRLNRAQLRQFDSLDREAFLKSFERQAGFELVPCLRGTGTLRGEMAFVARLNTNGHLSAVRVVTPPLLNDECATLAVKQMKFDDVAAPLKESLELQWRFVW